MKREAISEIAHLDAKKTSGLVFETLYTAMQKGWTRDDINEIITRLNGVDKSMKINVYRSSLVSELYGEIEKDKYTRENLPEVKKAILGAETLNIYDNSSINYFYPVKAKNDCLRCHTNVKVNDTLGVINISYPIRELKISLSFIINFFIVFITVFSLIIFLAIFLNLDKYIIQPIKDFSNVIKEITNSQDMKQRIEVNDKIEEMDSIKGVFNSMLDSIEHQFYNDSLTNLKNRRSLIEELERKNNLALMIINIDSFQEINDLYGDEAGDELLIEFSKYLQQITPNKDYIYRLHADEFAYLCAADVDIKEFINYAALISERITKKSFTISSKSEVNLSVTIGLSYGTDLLLANADTALMVAKKTRKNYLVYDDSMAMSKEYEKNFLWNKHLKQAIEEDRIIPVFQPIVDCKTKEIIKYESLMRIKNEDGTLIAPIHFLELAKKNKMYPKLTKIMINKTFEAFKETDKQVSINISVEDILNEDIYEYIMDKLGKCKINSNIVFEIIESEGIENFDEVFKFINDIKSFNAKVSIDDFGTGYSNFEYLMKLQVDYIKIDGSMIKNIDVDKNSMMITQTIVEFAKKMGIQTIAEFVYSKEVYEKTLELGVDYAQGYYFGEPKESIE
ncbi:EAL domain-containing protein [Sulfurimonas lithotrophica]|uniref:EAL domain-containing protein n=2 Tax=Sulfurimonas lithotrophica TaxID=2590022 RepID=A0A5P8P4K0_9BACT|nr:EAL domain-containing protein [Sulfurimonas lithotrophica]